MDFIRIPNLSPAFDAAWDTNGHQIKAFDLVTKWAKAQNLENCRVRVAGRSARRTAPHCSQQTFFNFAFADRAAKR